MQKQTILFPLMAILAMIFSASAAQDAKQKGYNAITESAVKGQLEFLASDWTEGRLTGTRGAYMAADYIASMFKVYGLDPGGDFEFTDVSRADRMAGKRPERYRSYYQAFELVEYEPGDVQELSLITTTKRGRQSLDLAYETDFSVRTSDIAMEVEAPVVFAGYGFKDEENGYNDYKGLDVKGKIVLILNGYPGHNDTLSNAYRKIGEQSRWSLYRSKGSLVNELGAAGIIEVYPGYDNNNRWAANIPMRYNSPDYEGDVQREYITTRMTLPGDKIESDPVRISLSNRALSALLDGTTIDLEQFEKDVAASVKPASEELKGKTIHLKTTVKSRIIKARNVVGVIPGKDTSEIIVVGGHYDHMGKHGGYIWNGADDNASGTVGVMTIAKAFAATGEKPEKTMVFCAWSGEERGLLGSRYFADHPYNEANMALNLNYDMISRDDPDDSLGVKCSLTYTEKYGIIEELTKKHNEEYELGLEVRYRPSERPSGGSDHAPFAAKDVPVMYFMAGFHPDYHTPADHVELVNWKKMTNIIRIGFLNTWELANTGW